MTTHDLTGAVWRKASYSNGNGGDCVEIADLANRGRAIRDSKNPTGTTLAFSAAEWSAFTAGVRSGQFG